MTKRKQPHQVEPGKFEECICCETVLGVQELATRHHIGLEFHTCIDTIACDQRTKAKEVV